jgi:uncharacterized protein YcbK (DUF882 family)
MVAPRATLVLLVPGRAAVHFDLQGLVRQAVLLLLVLPILAGAIARSGYEALRGQEPLALAWSDALGSLHRQLPLRAHAPGDRLRIVGRDREPRAAPARIEAGAGAINARAVLAAFGTDRAAAALPGLTSPDALLRLTASHLGESLRVRPFTAEGEPDPAAFAALSHLMRCRITGEEVPVHPALVRILVALGSIYRRPLNLISGHRAVDALGTSLTSQHTLGTAADIKIAGVSIDELRKRALELGARGVGLYPEKGFLHIDVRQRRRHSWIYTAAEGEQPYVSPEGVPRVATPVLGGEPAAPVDTGEGPEHTD